jgi:hypothetical protein
VAKQRLVKFRELQSQKAKYNDYDFKVNDLVLLRVEAKHNDYEFKESDRVLLRVEVRRKLRPSWRGFYEVKELRKPNAESREKNSSWRYCVCQVAGTTGAKRKIMEEGLSRF